MNCGRNTVLTLATHLIWTEINFLPTILCLQVQRSNTHHKFNIWFYICRFYSLGMVKRVKVAKIFFLLGCGVLAGWDFQQGLKIALTPHCTLGPGVSLPFASLTCLWYCSLLLLKGLPTSGSINTYPTLKMVWYPQRRWNLLWEEWVWTGA